MSGRLVHITLSDRGWILERLGKEIVARVSGISIDDEPDPSAPIQYYITYGCRLGRVSPCEIALFTHLEGDPVTKERFFQVAKNVDAAVAMSSATGEILRAAKIESHVIKPGVDLDVFRPRLKIGVVGRTYHTGRKGEALVNSVMDMPDIEWHFTGGGWPGPAINVPERELPAFYRSMDYVLVPASSEGGPMSVLEALASGVPVIGGPVGWVPDYPHITIDPKDPGSLRRTLSELLARKQVLRHAVEENTWDRWAEQHELLFRALAKERNLSPTARGPLHRKVRKVALVTHGMESTVLGGPTVRVPRTAAALREIGVDARHVHMPQAGLGAYDVVHLYNVWHPSTALRAARRVAAVGKPLVFSPIALDLSEAELWQTGLIRSFDRQSDILDGLGRWEAERASFFAGNFSTSLPEPGLKESLRELSALSDAFVFLSEKERDLVQQYTALPEKSRVIRNPVDFNRFSKGDPDLFRKAYGLQGKEYVLCVARVEHRKNQLLLAMALRSTGVPLVLVGNAGDAQYAEWVRKAGGENLLMIERLEPGSDMLRSALHGARVFALPSWAEGAPLAALEAAAAGRKMVLSDRSGEREYFGDKAWYCDPSNIESIAECITEAWERKWRRADSEALQAEIRERYTWQEHARLADNLYQHVSTVDSISKSPSIVGSTGARASTLNNSDSDFEIVFDITTSTNNDGLRSGIMRVEHAIGQELGRKFGARVRYVFFRNSEEGFTEVSQSWVGHHALKSYLQKTRPNRLSPGSFLPNSRLVVTGSSWMQNGNYATSLLNFAQQHSLELSVLMHDLTPVRSPHWFADGYASRFQENLINVLSGARRLLAYSKYTVDDIKAFAEEHDLMIPGFQKFRLADAIGTFNGGGERVDPEIQRRFSDRPFALAVGGIHARKNYALLYEVWILLRAKLGEVCPHLIIAGGVSWNGQDLARTIRSDTRVNKHIHIIDGIDDATLDWLYRESLFTVYASLHEGWGLPVGESLAYGKICIASNATSIPEIAPDLTDLLSPYDRVTWAARVEHYALSQSARSAREAQIRAGYHATTWEESAIQLEKALGVPIEPSTCFSYAGGEVVLLGTRVQVRRHVAGGLYPSEPWGCWGSDGPILLHMKICVPPEEDYTFTAVVQYFGPMRGDNTCLIKVNGREIARWAFYDNQSKVQFPVTARTAHVPRDLIDADGTVCVELLPQASYKVNAVSGSTDGRVLSLGLIGFWMAPASQRHRAQQVIYKDAGLQACMRLVTGDGSLDPCFETNKYGPTLPFNRVWLPDDQATVPIVYHGPEARHGVLPVLVNGLVFRGAIGAIPLDQPLQFDLTFQAAASVTLSTKVVVSVNGELVCSHVLSPGNTSVAQFAVSPAILARQDPALIVVLPSEGLTNPEVSGVAPIQFLSMKICVPGTESEGLELASWRVQGAAQQAEPVLAQYEPAQAKSGVELVEPSPAQHLFVGMDEVIVGTGIHPRSKSASNKTFRWLDAQSSLRLPGIAAHESTLFIQGLRASAEIDVADIKLSLNGKALVGNIYKNARSGSWNASASLSVESLRGDVNELEISVAAAPDRKTKAIAILHVEIKPSQVEVTPVIGTGG
ncbi:glycosyltransferase [Pseudoxanthobacter sp. M-2]|uniref:glycosyltransferase family 4 protein n=1 Tax=Pseudoxanthobacter sp. M-2 TaxID=3078754 RepID=UPI0038FBFFA8